MFKSIGGKSAFLSESLLFYLKVCFSIFSLNKRLAFNSFKTKHYQHYDDGRLVASTWIVCILVTNSSYPKQVM
jgi:hypothetical protein